jgi:hypothetical protein
MSISNTPDPAPEPSSQFRGMSPVAADGAVLSPNSEPLPADAPLTPEEIEDEAIRGDFMLRWAVILIAFLLGCTLINESGVLVRIKSGLYMQSHGIVPPRTDVFSIASDGKPWANLSWGLDHLLGLVYRVMGGTGLTLLTAVVAALIFWVLSLVKLAKVPTWWGSICAALALVGCFHVIGPSPYLATLLGIATTSLILHRFDSRPNAPPPWKLVPVFWVWAQLDPYVFIGMLLVLAYGLGDSFLQDERPDRSLGGLWKAIGAAVAVTLVHPFHINVFRAPVEFFRTELPQIREYFGGVFTSARVMADYSSILSAEFRQGASIFDWFAVGLAVLALGAQILNAKRLHWGWLLVFVALNGLAIACARFLPAAALANVVIAALNGQIWYLNTCRQTYSTNSVEVFLSRSGRAVTVIGLFALAYLAVNGALMESTGRRVGLGLHPDLLLATKSMQELAEKQLDDRPFHLYLSQGDYLIWNDRKSFVDNRLSLHASGALREHLTARSSLIEDRPAPDAWVSVFDQYKLSHIIVRTILDRDLLDVMTRLLQRQWIPTRPSSTGIVLYRPDQVTPEKIKFIQSEPLQRATEVAFRDKPRPEDQVGGPRDWPRPRGAYDRWLIQPRDLQSEGILRARQYSALLRQAPRIDPQRPSRGVIDLRMTMAIMTMREARIGLSRAPQKAEGYRQLGQAALDLQDLQRLLMPQGMGDDFWFNYALSGFQAARTIEPGNPIDHEILFNLTLSSGARDWALWHWDQLVRELEQLSPDLKMPKDKADFAEQLRQFVTEKTTALRGRLGIGTDRQKVVQECVEAGCWKLALELYEEDITVFSSPENAQLYAQLLLYAGRIEESWQVIEALEQQIPPAGTPGGERFATLWRNGSAMANLMNGGEDTSIQRWDSDRKAIQQTAAMNAIRILPLITSPAPSKDLRAMLATTNAGNQLGQAEQETMDGLHAALADLVCWRNEAAKVRLKELLDRNPETVLRTQILYFLSLLSPEKFIQEPPSQMVPTWSGMFAEEPTEPAPADASKDEAAEAKPPEKKPD